MPAKTTVNISRFHKEVGRSRFFKRRLRNHLQPSVTNKQKEMLVDFESHPVTQEIEAGPFAGNTSGLLSGYGNLFSFIGFNSGEKPIKVVRKILSKPAKIRKIEHFGGTKYRAIVTVPDKEKIFNSTPIPWAEGRSWIDGIEKGLSGFGFYLFSDSGRLESVSASGTAVQLRHKLRSGRLKNTTYISGMLRRFIRSLAKL